MQGLLYKSKQQVCSLRSPLDSSRLSPLLVAPALQDNSGLPSYRQLPSLSMDPQDRAFIGVRYVRPGEYLLDEYTPIQRSWNPGMADIHSTPLPAPEPPQGDAVTNAHLDDSGISGQFILYADTFVSAVSLLPQGTEQFISRLLTL
jgi:hypothetical protein